MNKLPECKRYSCVYLTENFMLLNLKHIVATGIAKIYF